MNTLDERFMASVRTHLVQGDGPGTAVERIDSAVQATGRLLDSDSLALLRRVLLDEFEGLGILQPILNDPTVTDLLINAPDEIWADSGRGLVRMPIRFTDESAVRQLAVRLAARAGRRLDDAAPFVDARLPSGPRLHAVLPPLSSRGTTISLRIPATKRYQFEDLIACGTVDRLGAVWLRRIVASKVAFLISGGTGSGKTTVLGALLGLVPQNERLVVVEDTHELSPDHPHVVSLESRPPNSEGAGEVSLRTLVRQALRMRPDRLVVGEVRGAEVVDLLAGLNTGHEGGAGTIHANAGSDVPLRIESLGLAAGMPLEGIRAQVACAIGAVIHVSRREGGQRVISQVGVVGWEGDRVVVREALRLRGDRLVASHAITDLEELVSHQALSGMDHA